MSTAEAIPCCSTPVYCCTTLSIAYEEDCERTQAKVHVILDKAY